MAIQKPKFSIYILLLALLFYSHGFCKLYSPVRD
jgi:hypothetical protein